MSDREELAVALERSEQKQGASWGMPVSVITTAARERLAQLPPYSEELVERIARAMAKFAVRHDIGKEGFLPDVAVAVLDALNGETP